MRCVAAIALLVASLIASAREADGALGLIRSPHDGSPALVRRGETFPVMLTVRARLELRNGDASTPLAVAWAEPLQGLEHGICTVPADAPVGLMALHAQTDSVEDTCGRAVLVVDDFPTEYLVAHLSDWELGGANHHPNDTAAILARVIERVNASGAYFVLVTGDLTANGTDAEFRAALGLLDACILPTFVTPGANDVKQGRYTDYFGETLTRVFRFGEDAFLTYDTAQPNPLSDEDEQVADLYRLRRDTRAARWSIGFTHRIDPNQGMRGQLVLFADDPLDYLLFGSWHRANREGESRLPWGRTRIIVAPAAADGALRLIGIGQGGITPQPVEYVATGE